MAKYLVAYYECYSREYEVEANSKGQEDKRMSKYAIRVREILSRTVIVDNVESIDEALYEVGKQQKMEDLDYDDYDDRDIEPSPYFDGEILDDEDVSYYQHINEKQNSHSKEEIDD